MNRELSIGNWGGMSRRNPPEDALCKWDGDVQEELGEEPTRRCSIWQELYGLQTQNVHTGYFSLNVLEQQKSFFEMFGCYKTIMVGGRWVRSKFSEFYSIFIFCLSFVWGSGFGILKFEKGKGYVVSLQCPIHPALEFTF